MEKQTRHVKHKIRENQNSHESVAKRFFKQLQRT